MPPHAPSDRRTATTRRRVLVGVGLAGATAVAGCIEAPGEAPSGTAAMPTRLWLDPVEPPDDAAVDPIEYGSLTAAEHDLLDAAIAEGEYVVDTDDTSPALESLRDRIEARTDRGNTLAVYLVRDGRDYRVGFANGDHIVAHPDP